MASPRAPNSGRAGFTTTPPRGATNKGIQPRLHPKLPIQKPSSVWTFDGTFPGKLIMARYGQPLLFRHYNALPIAAAANGGFGINTMSTHLHNGHNPAESDGFPGAYFYPGQYYDYRWPLILSGYGRVNTDYLDPRSGYPDEGGDVLGAGDWQETLSTLWFHDHRIDHTAENVYKGMVGMMNVYGPVDRGREGRMCHYADPANNFNLCLPSGTRNDWGNRDYDVNLAIADKAWDATGQLYFNLFSRDGFLGDRITVNCGVDAVSWRFARAAIASASSTPAWRASTRSRWSPRRASACRSTWSPTTAISWSMRSPSPMRSRRICRSRRSASGSTSSSISRRSRRGPSSTSSISPSMRTAAGPSRSPTLEDALEGDRRTPASASSSSSASPPRCPAPRI